MNVKHMVNTLEEAEASFDKAMEERLELEMQIEQQERQLALAAVDEQIDNQAIMFDLITKRRALIDSNRRLSETNRVLAAAQAENERKRLA